MSTDDAHSDDTLLGRVGHLLRATRVQLDHLVTAVAQSPGLERLKIDAAFLLHERDRLLDKLGIAPVRTVEGRLDVPAVMSQAIERIGQVIAWLSPAASPAETSAPGWGHRDRWTVEAEPGRSRREILDEDAVEAASAAPPAGPSAATLTAAPAAPPAAGASPDLSTASAAGPARKTKAAKKAARTAGARPRGGTKTTGSASPKSASGQRQRGADDKRAAGAAQAKAKAKAKARKGAAPGGDGGAQEP